MLKTFLHFFLAFIAYFAAGYGGLALAIPPGFASAVWPASGVALAFVLVLRPYAVYLGVACASFLLNLGVLKAAESSIDLSNLGLPACIATGAALQAAFGAFLYRKLVDKSNALVDSPKSVLRFLLVVAPLSCTIAATVGVGSLYLFGIISENVSVFSWLTWWVGDAIGIMLFTPLLHALLSTNTRLSMSRKAVVVVPTSMVFLCVLGLFFVSLEYQKHSAQRQIDEVKEWISNTIAQRIFVTGGKFEAYKAFYAGSQSVEYGELYTFSEELLSNDHLVTAVGWSQEVQHENRAQVEQWLNEKNLHEAETTPLGIKQRHQSGRFVSVENKDVYYPLLSVYPQAYAKTAIGFDLSSEPQRAAAIRKSILTGEIQSTGPLDDVVKGESNLSVIMFLPIFDRNEGGEQESANIFKGVITASLKIEDMLKGVISHAKERDLGFHLTDITERNNHLNLYHMNEAGSEFYQPSSGLIHFYGRSYYLEVFALKTFNGDAKNWASWIILTGGFLFAVMLQALILIITGITESTKKEVERKTRDIMQAKLQAEAASQAKSDFTANVTHEIRTPLNAITGFINLCLKTTLSGRQQHYLENAKLASSTLLGLVNQTLDFSKIEAGQLELTVETFSLSSSLRKIYALFASQCNARDIEFRVSCEKTVPETWQGDVLRIEQILLNLCGNAIKFTSQGSVAVEISAKARAEEQTEEWFLQMVVKDTGIGIPEEKLSCLFDAYSQLDSSISRRYGGTGLGLTIVKHFVELMNGKISVVSGEAQGTAFTLELPLRVINPEKRVRFTTLSSLSEQSVEFTDTPNAKKIEDASAASDSLEKPLFNTRLLLVEDNEINQFIAQEMLDDLGAKVVTVDNGQEALDYLEKDRNFDAILMDLQMPVLDGYSATKAIRANEDTKTLPIIAMTANVMQSDIDKCASVGMNGHIGKPIEEVDLVEKVRRVLQK